MEDEKKQQQDGQTGEQNPTLNSPGSQVADYGNPTGGSAAGSPQEGNQQQGASESIPLDNDETIGTP
ncbi:MAG TPA: hypothetical protein VF609_14440 [Flavisolibacter sp.]